MPTHKDETLPQRYAREHQDYIKLCGSMTAEQVADLQLQLNNALARGQAMQQRLTAADERVDVLEGLLRKTLAYFTEPGMPEDLLAEFKAALARATNSCTWQYGAYSWRTSCGEEWMLNDGTPEQNGMRFCHSCGKTLVVEGEPA